MLIYGVYYLISSIIVHSLQTLMEFAMLSYTSVSLLYIDTSISTN